MLTKRQALICAEVSETIPRNPTNTHLKALKTTRGVRACMPIHTILNSVVSPLPPVRIYVFAARSPWKE